MKSFQPQFVHIRPTLVTTIVTIVTTTLNATMMEETAVIMAMMTGTNTVLLVNARILQVKNLYM